MFLLIIFFPIFIFFLKDKSIVTFILTILVVSLLGTLLLGKELEIVDFKDFFMLILTATLLLLIILPWKRYKNITLISVGNEKKFNKLVNFLILINAFTFIILLITTIIVQTSVDDINYFKYTEGVSSEFYSTMLPFRQSYLSLTLLIYGLSYFMMPLHFYFLSKHKYKLSIICFILSLNIILKGALYFSRYVIIEFSLLYISMFLISRNTLSKKTIKTLQQIGFIFFSILLIIFISISEIRFDDSTNTYLVPYSSVIKDPVVYSYIDYLSQWYFNGADVLRDYDFETFNGKITFSSLNEILGRFNIITYSPTDYQDLRMQLWKGNWYTFTGFTAYSIYDYGIAGSLIFCIFYFLIIVKISLKDGSISITNYFLVSLLIQIPLMAIFYSQMGNLVYPILYYLFIATYLKMKIH